MDDSQWPTVTLRGEEALPTEVREAIYVFLETGETAHLPEPPTRDLPEG